MIRFSKPPIVIGVALAFGVGLVASSVLASRAPNRPNKIHTPATTVICVRAANRAFMQAQRQAQQAFLAGIKGGTADTRAAARDAHRTALDTAVTNHAAALLACQS